MDLVFKAIVFLNLNFSVPLMLSIWWNNKSEKAVNLFLHHVRFHLFRSGIRAQMNMLCVEGSENSENDTEHHLLIKHSYS